MRPSELWVKSLGLGPEAFSRIASHPSLPEPVYRHVHGPAALPPEHNDPLQYSTAPGLPFSLTSRPPIH